MEHKTWTTMDKSTWGDGPWQAEPDKEQWQDAATGLPCLIRRNQMGALCGYVGVTEGHPWYGKSWDEIEPYPDVHGGLTYSGFCQDGPDAETICHVAAPGEPDRVFWAGFDCHHAFDLGPAMAARERATGLTWLAELDQEYRPAAYVKAECARLAAQAAAAASPSSP